MLRPFFVAIALLVLPASAGAALYPGGSFGFANNGCGSDGTLTVPDDFPVAAIRIHLDLGHDAAQELEMRLSFDPDGPDPKTVILFSDNPAFTIPWSYNDSRAALQGSYVFDDAAGSDYAAAVGSSQLATVPPGSYFPDATALNSLAGSSSKGNWQLQICDLMSSGTPGTVNSWTLELVEAPQPVPASAAWAKALLGLALGGAIFLVRRA